MDLYVDTSALVKRYALEPGSAWIQNLLLPQSSHDAFTVRITAPELIAALYRRVRTGAMPSSDAEHAEVIFRGDWRQQFRLLHVNDAVVERAMTLARRYVLRGYDAVHVAAALELNELLQTSGRPPLLFISADQEQLRAAAAEGLTVDDPNMHP